jgi:hypothetical protein
MLIKPNRVFFISHFKKNIHHSTKTYASLIYLLLLNVLIFIRFQDCIIFFIRNEFMHSLKSDLHKKHLFCHQKKFLIKVHFFLLQLIFTLKRGVILKNTVNKERF